MAGTPQFEYRQKQTLRLKRVLSAAIVLMALCVVLFPVMVRARSTFGIRSCASNLRQIGQAISLYMLDHDDRFPAGVDPSDKAIPTMWASQPKLASQIKKLPFLQDALSGYVKSREVFHCPDDKGGLVMENTFGAGDLRPFVSAPTMFANYGTSYLFRTEIVFKSLADRGYEPGPKVGVLFDGYGHWHAGTEPLSNNVEFREMNYLVNTFRYNTLYGDGHVQTLSFQELQQTWAQKL